MVLREVAAVPTAAEVLVEVQLMCFTLAQAPLRVRWQRLEAQEGTVIMAARRNMEATEEMEQHALSW